MENFDVCSVPLSGANLIEASAGTGKTYNITMLFLRMIVELKFSVNEILVVTFTVPATMELRKEIRDTIARALEFLTSVLSEKENTTDIDENIKKIILSAKDDFTVVQRLRSALKTFDEASIYTIHSFCQQVLSERAFESKELFLTEIVTDDLIIERLIKDFIRKEIYTLPESLATMAMEYFDPSKLFSLYIRRPLSSELIIKPKEELPAQEEFLQMLSSFDKAFQETKAAWQMERIDIENFIRCRENFKGNTKIAKRPDDYLEILNQFMENGFIFIYNEFSESLQRLTLEGISKDILKGKGIPDSITFFNFMSKVHLCYEKISDFVKKYAIALRYELFTFIDTQWDKLKKDKGKKRYNDLIIDLAESLKDDLKAETLIAKISTRYKAALIDEFQDTDDLQYEIFHKVFIKTGSIIFLIGDPKQAIYKFRGADIFSYINASKNVSKRYTLNYNYRSTPELVRSINLLFSIKENPFILDEIKFNAVEPCAKDAKQLVSENKTQPAIDIFLPDLPGNNSKGIQEELVIKKILCDIQSLTSDRFYFSTGERIKASDIAILVRTHHQATKIKKVLSRYNIPSVMRGHESIFKTEEAGEVLILLSAIAFPSRISLVKKALATKLMAKNSLELFAIHRKTNEGENFISEFTERLYFYRDLWLHRGFMTMFMMLLDKENITVRILAREEGTSVFSNIMHIAEILNKVSFEDRYSPDELILWFEDAVANELSGEEFNKRIDLDGDAVNIITMHASKGLEYPIVFCPYLSDIGKLSEDFFVYHDPEACNKPVMFIGDDDGEIKPMAERERLAEDLRLMYVALTRAKSQCRIYIINHKEFYSSALAYILASDCSKGNFNFDQIINTLGHLQKESGGDIKFSYLREAGINISSTAQAIPLENLQCKIFSGSIKQNWSIQSYSSMASRFSDEKTEPYTKNFLDIQDKVFPSGAKAGLCIHEIFEKLDFHQRDDVTLTETIRPLLRKYGFDDKWVDYLKNMFIATTDCPLPEANIRLSSIDKSHRISELEFNFPLNGFSFSEFRKIFHNAPSYSGMIYNILSDNDEAFAGLMKGFIDLLFMVGDRYYIIDWKSNLLEFYTQDNIESEMSLHNYYLQYHIYTLALHRYLKWRMGSIYSYDKNFGGVFYIFVRGISQNGNGIFYDLPDSSVINNMDKLFTGEF